MNKWIRAIIIVLLLTVFSFSLPMNASAADGGSIKNKWIYTQLYNCAKNQFNGNATNMKKTVLESVVGDKGSLGMPSEGFQGMPSNAINCQELMTSYAGVQNADWSDERAADAVLTKLGYGSSNVANKMDVEVTYDYSHNGIASKPGSDTLKIKITPNVTSGYSVTSTGEYLSVSSGDNGGFRICNKKNKKVCTKDIAIVNDTVQLTNNIGKALQEANLNYTNNSGVTYTINPNLNSISVASLSVGYVYPPSGSSRSQAAAKTLSNYSGMGLSNIKLSNSELYTLYMYYLNHNATIACGTSDGRYTTRLKTTDGSFKKCTLDFGDKTPASIRVNTQNTSGSYPTITTTSLAGILAWFNTVDTSTLTDIDDCLVPPDGVVEIAEETQEDVGAEEDGDVDCQSSGAAQSLGWIVCPILNWMERTSTNLYEEYVEPALIVDPGLFNNGPGVKQAWDTFQRISNTIFIVLLLVIIISQITGFGIDNYGIKKILPKLIVVAILTNLSYYICLIAVDVSNIVGSSVQSMFTGLGNGLNMSVSIEGSSKAIGSTAISAVAVLGALVTMGTAVWANPAIVLTLFISAIGVVFSIFFLFIILAAREAAVVVLVVAAPVAIACYILPNTKKIFDSWMKMFGGLLLVFPICGLLVGGGNYISKLLLSTGSAANGVFNAFAAMVVGIVPIFFIPSVLKNSFGAMGNLGAKIAGVGKTVGGGVQRAATNSNLNRSLQESGAERRARFMGGLNADGTAKDLSTVGRMIRGGSRNIARNRATALGNMDKRFREKRLMGTGYDAALAGMNAKVEKAAVEDAQALIESGAEVNPNDVSAMNYFHADALREYHNATTDAGREAAMARIQAAQNIMAKTDKGRAGIQTNYENALRNNEARGVTQAASHLMSNYGAQIKNVNRGEFGFISDLSTAQTDAVGNIDTADYQKVLTNMNTDVYNAAGTDKYTPESLANADEMALDRLYNSMGSMTNEQRRNIQSTVRNAISKSRTTNLNIKPEVRAKMEKIDKWRPPTVHNPNP